MLKKGLLLASILTVIISMGIFVFREDLFNNKITSALANSMNTNVAKNSPENSPQAKQDKDIKAVHLEDNRISEFGIELAKAGPGNISIHIDLPGQIALNGDRVAHIVPRVSGIARKVLKTLGDTVLKGEVMAVLESRVLADAKAGFLAARERVSLARANFKREEKLWKRKITSEQEYLEAKQAYAEAKIQLRSYEQKLHALGFSEEYLKKLPTLPDISYTRYPIVAPFSGTVIEKHIVLGEFIRDDTTVYVVSDLSSVWVNISIYQKDLPLVKKGLPVIISARHGSVKTRGVISYVGPLVGQKTRTALARVILANKRGILRPGLFVTATIQVAKVKVPVLIPKSAIHDIEGKPSVFVKKGENFYPVTIQMGRTNEKYAEITSGLLPGQLYVVKGGFTLKAQLSKGAFGDGHGH